MRADLGAVREAATLLAAQEREPTFAADAAPSLQDIRDAAATVRDASSLTAASAAAGALGVVASSDLVHELAVVGLGAKDSAARGAVYGRLVAACSACHEAMGRAPGARVDTAGE